MNNGRVRRWDSIKGLLIMLVVIGHFLMYVKSNENAQRILLLIYSFHMPAFVFVSGLFSKKGVEQKSHKKSVHFLLIFLLIKALLAISDLVVGNKSPHIYLIDDVSWYAFALAAFYEITKAFTKCRTDVVLMASILLACVVGYIDSINTIFSMSRLFVFFPIFFAGYKVDSSAALNTISRKEVKQAGLIILVCYTSLILLFVNKIWPSLGLMQGKYPYSEFLRPDMVQYGGVLRFIWYMVALIVAVSVAACWPDKTIVESENTLFVYILHIPIIKIFMHSFLAKVLKSRILFLVIAGILLTLILDKISSAMRNYQALDRKSGKMFER